MSTKIHVPDDSFLHCWCQQFANTEIWDTWKIATGLGIVGAVLGRAACFSYGEAGTIWPNTSVLLVGESGDGKDTIIRPAERVLEEVGVKFVAGKTIEAVKLSLYNIGDPAVGYIAAKELAEFLGAKDYQSGIMESLTDILSNNDRVDITTKTDLIKGSPRIIHNPTLTMFAGSTPDWLQNNLPAGALGGGFLGRFIVATEVGSKTAAGISPVPNPGVYPTFAMKTLVESSKSAFRDQIKDLYLRYKDRKLVKFIGEESAEDYYNNWYCNRLSYFSPVTRAYANRSGGLLRKLAMLMAATRGHSYIEEIDYHFGSEFILYIAQNLERSVISTSKEVTVGYALMPLLPCANAMVIRHLSGKYGPLWVKRAIHYLLESRQITNDNGILRVIPTAATPKETLIEGTNLH